MRNIPNRTRFRLEEEELRQKTRLTKEEAAQELDAATKRMQKRLFTSLWRPH